MMKGIRISSLALPVALILLGVTSGAVPPTTREHSSVEPRVQQGGARERAAELRKQAKFVRASGLLKGHGVSFEPDALLSRHWRTDLAQELADIPEMSLIKHHTGALKGVVMADTLELPTLTQVVADTVIVVRRLKFASRHPVVRLGPTSVHIFVIDPVEFEGDGPERPTLHFDARGLGRGNPPVSLPGRTAGEGLARWAPSDASAAQVGGPREPATADDQYINYSLYVVVLRNL